MPDDKGLAAQTEAFELDDIERKAAHLMHQWLARAVGELDGNGGTDLAVVAERAEQTGQVLDLLERVLEGVELVRETLD